MALVVAACGGDDDSDGTPGPSAVTGECAPNLDVSLGELTWPGLFPSELVEKDEWRVLRGQAESPYVSVSRDREVVGAITLVQTQLEGDFLPAEGFEALRVWIDDFYAEVEADRVSTYGDTFELTTAMPAETQVGTFCALTYGYVGMDGDEETDRLAGYATFDRGSLYLIAAEFDATVEAAEGFHGASTLADFEPVFPDFIASLSLPPGSSAATEAPTQTPEGAAPTE